MIKFGSVCSGIESASVAWEPLGLKPNWFSEIEPFPSAVLAHHWPNVKNLGDMCNLPEMISKGIIEAPDILVGGTPCQAFSVAGKREGLENESGQLTIKFVEIADEIDKKRHGRECIIVWENVPGVLSSKDNAFGCLLGKLAGEDCELHPSGKKWTNAGCVFGTKRTIAWRILDAQYFGVAQRRRRVFVIASARKGFDPCQVLFEFEGLRRDIKPSRKAREETTRQIGPSLASGETATGTLMASDGNAMWTDSQAAFSGNYTIVYPFNKTIHKVIGTDLYNGLETGDIAATLGTPGSSVSASGPTVMECFDRTAYDQYGEGLVASTCRSRDYTEPTDLVVSFAENVRSELRESEVTNALTGGGGKPGQGYAAIREGLTVRRLTPIECERLQGFPDNHTQIPWRNKPAEDCPIGQRYKVIGNSKAVPVVRWIGERIIKELEND